MEIESTSGDATQIETDTSSSVPQSVEDGSGFTSDRSSPTGPSAVPNDRLTCLECVGVLSVLEDCVDQMNILGFTNNKPQTEATIVFKTLEERFRELSEEKSGSQDDDVMAVGGIFDKLQADRSFLEKTVRTTIDELTSNRTFRRLKYIDSQVKAMKNDEENLVYEERGNSAELNYLRNKLKEERLHRVAELRMREELIAKLKDDIQNIIVNSESKQRFVDRWESSRVEQKEMRLEKAERKLKEMDTQIKYREDMEMRVHSEVDTFLRQALDKVEDQIQSWMVRYSREVEEKKVQLSVLKIRKQQDYRKLEELTIIFNQRLGRMKAYLAVKEEKQRKQAHEIFLDQSATRIQAWWKGTMVRRGLGPYRKKRKDKGKKGKSTAKKGKK